MKLLYSLALLLFTSLVLNAAAPKREFFEIKIYTIENAEQEKVLDDFLKNAYLPALHRAGITRVGVFKPIESDTVYFGKRLFVITPFSTLDQFTSLDATLQKDKAYLDAGKAYIDAPYTSPPFTRLETVILQAFTYMPKLEAPKLTSPAAERVYELRSYESYTEKIYKNKVKMFNEGGEVTLFKRLGFNAVFYAEVLAGSRQPNLMYMTSFENRASRDDHWKTFVADAEWKKLSSMPEYQKNVSKINIYLLHPAAYSDL
jgi:hypothetical protein